MSFTRRARAACWQAPAAVALGVALAACGVAAEGAGSPSKSTPGATGRTAAAVGKPAGANSAGARVEVADPKEAESYPAPASAQHAPAAAPTKAGETIVAAGALSDAEVRRELAETQAAQRRAASERKRTVLKPVPGGQSIGGDGTLPIPAGIPETVQKVIAGANEIANFPYVFGGGHGSFVDDAYDCSGSVSYALAAGGLLSLPETSGELERWGKPGPGRYITVFANAGHTYMYVDGILYDTAGRSGVYASRWLVGSTDNTGYVARHWPGL
jgi:cell wall-associated NlpC family hydrolase